MRLIDADALIEKVRDEAKGMTEPLSTELPIFVDWLVEKIPTVQPEQHWIQCSKGLPKKPDRYLVTVHPDYIVPNGSGVDMLLWQEGKWQFFDELLHLTEFPDPIIAWMPQPKPYQEGEKNDS